MLRIMMGYESKCLKTVGTDGWFVIFRLCGPLPPFFDKSLVLPGFEMVNLHVF